jgi:hypothetical protein
MKKVHCYVYWSKLNTSIEVKFFVVDWKLINICSKHLLFHYRKCLKNRGDWFLDHPIYSFVILCVFLYELMHNVYFSQSDALQFFSTFQILSITKEIKIHWTQFVKERGCIVRLCTCINTILRLREKYCHYKTKSSYDIERLSNWEGITNKV